VGPRGLSLLGFAILALAVAALLARQALFGRSVPAVAVQIAAAGLMIWARLTFGRRSFHAGADPTEGGLVTSGPYRYLRHPIYAAILWFVAAGALSHVSAASLLLLAMAVVGAALRIAAEEHLLLGRYPEYAQYAARTKRVIPFLL
jgi:protein-S-isoprenylcysteine O-methyltransferase Ste14